MAVSKNETTADQIFRDLKNKIYRPVYFFWGEEPYYIDRLTEYMMQNILTEAEKAFNLTVMYGKDTDASAVINNARRFPMMANHQLVILREAQELKNFDELIHYIKNPLKSTILVINYKYKSPDKRKSVYKTLAENAEVFESKKIYENKVPEWIAGQLAKKKYQIEGKAAFLLTEFLGNDLSRITNELEKLMIVLGENRKMITSADIEKNIGISKEFNNFELQSALASRDILKANRIINFFADNQKNNNIVVTLSVLYLFFSKILVFHYLPDKSRNAAAAALKVPPFYISDYEKAASAYNPAKTRQVISLLREYDLRSKGFGSGSSAEAGDLMKELIFKILH